jgi:outer membrane protein TolC
MNKTVSLSTVAFAALALSGCYTPEPLPAPITSKDYTSIKEEDHITLPKETELLTLEAAQELALKNNPTYRSRRHAIAIARSRYYQQIANYYPTVDTYYSVSQTDTNPDYQYKTSYDNTESTTQRMGITANLLIFDGLQRTMNVLGAKYGVKQVEALEKNSRRLLIEAVSTSYNGVLLAKENIRIAITDKKFQQRLLDDTKIKYDAGAVPLSDVLNFQIKVNDAETAEVASNFRYKTERHALAALLGFTTGTIDETVKFPTVEDVAEAPVLGLDLYLDMALHNRPDLKAYREATKIAKYTEYARMGVFAPVISAFAGYSTVDDRTDVNHRRSSATRDYLHKNRSDTLNYGIQATLNLFNGGKDLERLREAQMLLGQANLALEDIWIQVITEVRQAYDNFQRDQKELALYEKSHALQNQQRDLVEEQYKVGTATLTRLNEAQRDLTKADTNRVAALINLKNSKIKLLSVTSSSPLMKVKEEDNKQ